MPTEMQSINENDVEYFAGTGVNRRGQCFQIPVRSDLSEANFTFSLASQWFNFQANSQSSVVKVSSGSVRQVWAAGFCSESKHVGRAAVLLDLDIGTIALLYF